MNATTTRRRFLHGAGAAGVGAYLTACGGSGRPEAGTGGVSQLRVIVPYTPDLLATTHVAQGAGGPLLLALEPLLKLSPEFRLEPNLARVTRVTPQRYVCRLRPGVTFWDGSALTTADVIASIEVHTKPDSKSAIADLWAGADLKQTGASELTITLRDPDPAFLFTLAQTGISSAAFNARHGSETGTPKVLVMGTGPYRPVAFTPNARIGFVRNEHYWGPRPRFAKVQCRTIEDQATALQAVQTGAGDVIIGIPISQAAAFGRIGSVELTRATDASVYKFNLDQQKRPWADPHLRRAFAHGINRSALSQALAGDAVPATTLVPPEFLGAVLEKPALDAAYTKLGGLMPAFDVAAGKRELAQSTVPDGLTTDVLVSSGDPTLSTLIQAVAPSLAEIGIVLNPREVDNVTYARSVYFEHKTDGLSLDDFGAESPDAGNIPFDTLSSANAVPKGNGVNIADYVNPQVDALLARQAAAPAATRGGLIVDVLAQAARDLPYVPLVYPKVLAGVATGYRYSGFNAFWWMNRWTELITAVP